MSDMLSYKGYTARIEFDAEDRLFVGRVSGIEDGVGFHAETVEGLMSAFYEAIDDYLQTCDRLGKQPEHPETGVLRLRLDPDLLARLTRAAGRTDQTVDEFSVGALSRAVASDGDVRIRLGNEQFSFRERSIEMTERAEGALVAKDARVVEEVVVRKDADTRTETVDDTVRRTEVEVENLDTERTSTSGYTGTSGTRTDRDRY